MYKMIKIIYMGAIALALTACGSTDMTNEDTNTSMRVSLADLNVTGSGVNGYQIILSGLIDLVPDSNETVEYNFCDFSTDPVINYTYGLFDDPEIAPIYGSISYHEVEGKKFGIRFGTYISSVESNLILPTSISFLEEGKTYVFHASGQGMNAFVPLTIDSISKIDCDSKIVELSNSIP